MKDLEAKLSLEDVKELFDPELSIGEGDGVATVGLLIDVRTLLVEVLNELRTIRALHCNLPWPEHAQGLEVKGA